MFMKKKNIIICRASLDMKFIIDPVLTVESALLSPDSLSDFS